MKQMANFISSSRASIRDNECPFFLHIRERKQKEREHKKTKKIITIIIKCHPVSLLHFCCGSIYIF